MPILLSLQTTNEERDGRASNYYLNTQVKKSSYLQIILSYQ